MKEETSPTPHEGLTELKIQQIINDGFRVHGYYYKTDCAKAASAIFSIHSKQVDTFNGLLKIQGDALLTEIKAKESAREEVRGLKNERDEVKRLHEITIESGKDRMILIKELTSQVSKLTEENEKLANENMKLRQGWIDKDFNDLGTLRHEG